MSDEDSISILAYPVIEPDNIPENELRELIDLGESYLKKGDITRATRAFVLGLIILLDVQPHRQARYGVEIRAQFASVKLHQRLFTEAEEILNAALQDVGDGVLNNRERNVVERWIAISVLRQGHYEQAAKRFNSLLETIHAQDPDDITTEMLIRRDLALASACQGDHQLAFGHINAAKNCLKRVIANLNMSPQLLSQAGEIGKSLSTEISTGGEMQKNDLQGIPDMAVLNELAAKRADLYFAESKIHRMWGDYKAALEVSETALGSMKERWGENHLKTLECVSHHSLLLAFNSRISEAEAMCNSAGAETRNQMRYEHPQTLETAEHMARIFLFQSRLVVAGDTAKSAANTAEKFLTADHPQTHRTRYLVAQALLAAGHYASAEAELEGIITNATRMYGEYHPDTLRYQSQLALTKHYMGKLQEAEKLAIYVLQEQRKIYAISKPDESTPEATHDPVGSHRSVKTLLEYRPILNDFLSSISNHSADLRIHPCLLDTLRTIGLILAQPGEDPGVLALEIFRVIWERNKFYLDKASIITLDSEYDLALAYWEKTEDVNSSLNTAARHLRHVYRKRSSILGPKHPATVSARRQLIATNCALGRWEPSLDTSEGVRDHAGGVSELDNAKWGRVQAESLNIVSMHEESFGDSHPETLISLLWLCTVQVFLRNEKGLDGTCRKGLGRLRYPAVRGERLIKSLSLERKFALAVSDGGDKYEPKALRILCETSDAIEQQLKTNPGALRKNIELLKPSIDDDHDVEQSCNAPSRAVVVACVSRWAYPSPGTGCRD
ncbi:hypothetical protein F5X97DRAFT_304790 [Nemania serpens]|nr:hypothetical protein F5X97DRAFT_304790 [Nemania serpens]